MDTITTADKSSGGTFTAAEYNEVKRVVNANASDTWDDVTIPIQASSSPAADPPTIGTYYNGVQYAFNTADRVNFTIQLPHGYKLGSNVGIHFHFVLSAAIASGTTYNPTFKLTYNVAAIGADFNTIEGSNAVSKELAGPLGVDTHQLWDLGVIEHASYPMGISALLLCELTLTDKDGYPGTINILSIDAHVLKDTIGSANETSK